MVSVTGGKDNVHVLVGDQVAGNLSAAVAVRLRILSGHLDHMLLAVTADHAIREDLGPLSVHPVERDGERRQGAGLGNNDAYAEVPADSAAADTVVVALAVVVVTAATDVVVAATVVVGPAAGSAW